MPLGGAVDLNPDREHTGQHPGVSVQHHQQRQRLRLRPKVSSIELEDPCTLLEPLTVIRAQPFNHLSNQRVQRFRH
jgi:hypothetical protein